MVRRLIKILGGMAVEDRPAKGHMVGRIAIAAQRHVPSGQHELELAVARLAKDGNTLVMAEAARINDRIRLMADEVADWSAAAAGHPEYFGADPRLIHPDDTGRAVLIPLVRAAIERCFRQLNR